MNEYMLQLVNNGIAPHEAYCLYHDFVREYGLDAFKEFVADVYGIQSESDRQISR